MAGRITWAHTLYCTLLALWWGSLVTVGAIAVPVVFASLAMPQSADTAVLLFRLQGLLGFVIMVLLALCLLCNQLRLIVLEIKILAGVLLLAVLLQFWVIPEMLAQRGLPVKEPLWHAASTALYALQLIGVLWVFIQRVSTPTLSVAAMVKSTALPGELDAVLNQPLVKPIPKLKDIVGDTVDKTV